MSAGAVDVWEGSHLEFALSESNALIPSEWERWYDRVERALGFSLDGDDSEVARHAGTSDGYSVDGAYDAWARGDSVQKHVADVRVAIADLQEARRHV